MGRQTKYKNDNSYKDEPKKVAVLASLANGATIGESCVAAGIGRQSYYEWMHRDAGFNKASFEAQNSRVAVVEDALMTTAIGGNITALIFWLCNRAPDRWKSINNTTHTFSREMDESLMRLTEVIKAASDKKKESR